MLPDAAQYVEPDEVDLLVFEAIVPKNHYLRKVMQAIDFERCRELLVSCYCKDLGRRAIEPILLLKLEFLEFHYNLSDREVISAAQVNMAFRYFLHLSRRSPLPHHTMLTHFRNRLGVEKHQQVFDDVVGQAREHGLVKDRLRLKDATHIIANIAVPSTIRLVGQTRKQLLLAAKPFAPQRVAEEEARADAIRLATTDASDKERLLQRVSHLQEVVACVDTLIAGLPASTELCWQRLQEALQVAHKVLADRHNEKQRPKWNQKKDKLISVHDPDARYGWHHGYYYGFVLDVSMDAHSNIITAVNMLPANADEAADATTLITHEEQTHGNDVAGLSIDGAGFRGELLHEWSDPQGLNLDVTVPPPAEAEATVFAPEAFKLDASGETLTCPAGQTTSERVRRKNDNAWQFCFADQTCAACPIRSQCQTPQCCRRRRGRRSKRRQGTPSHGRRVLKNDYEADYQQARAKAQTAAYQEVRRQHPAIERKLSELVRHHGARHARYRRQGRVLVHGLLTALVVNVKRIVHFLALPLRAEVVPTG